MDKPWTKFYEPGVPASLTYPNISLYDLVNEACQKYPDKTAIKFILSYIAGGRLTIGGKMTYRQLDQVVNAFAGALYDMGVRKGDRVALMMPNAPQFVIAFFGAARIGATVVNFNPTYTSPEIKHQLADSGAETMVIWNMAYPRLKAIQAETRVKNVIIAYIHEATSFPFSILVKSKQKKEKEWNEPALGNGVYSFDALLDQHKTAPKVEVDPDDVALFQYTGGTTGVPKAAMLTHRNIVANVLQTKAWLVTCELGREKMLAAIPFFHVYGMTIAMIYGLHIGAELLITPNPRLIPLLMDIIQAEGVTLFPGVPAMYSAIINNKDVAKYNLRSVKACISGSAPLHMSVQEKFGEITGGRLVEGYGLTEAAPVTHCNPVYGRRKEGSIGIPFPDVEAKIVGLDTGLEQPVGQPGELWVRGPQVMKGYWNKPEETAKTITPDGWLMTGDIATMDEDGYFRIVDRKKELILVGGFNVYPNEVEQTLTQHPAVEEAIVIGIPTADGNERVKAFVKLKAGQSATEQEIMDFCKDKLVYYKVPRAVEFRSELPKSQVGKLLRRVIADEERSKRVHAQA